MSLPAPIPGQSDKGYVWSRAGVSSWGDKLCLCSSLVLSSHPSQPLADMGLLSDLGPKMALGKACGTGEASLGGHCRVPAT